jgi:DNA polymerase III gamma/tau subunit
MFENIAVIPSFRNAVSSAVSSGKLSHALIFEGASEEIRFAAAKETAKALLCHGDDRPCGNCSACHKVDSMSHPDLHIVSADGAMIKVDSIRDVKDKAKVFPNDGNKSVFIICEAHNMNPQAQNALLKIFEEPASHVSFILTCPSKSSLLDTIISRATAYYLGEEYTDKKTDLQEKADALSAELLSCAVNGNELSFIRKTAVFQKDKALFSATLQSMQPILRDALALSAGAKNLIGTDKAVCEELRSKLTQKKLMELLVSMQELKASVDNAANHNLALTRLSAIIYSIK